MIKKLDIQNRETARKVLAVQLPAYQIEAEMIDYWDLPPLKDTEETLQACNELFFGWYADEDSQLGGVISFKKKGDVIDIHRLVVHPGHFRKGGAGELLRYLEETYKGYVFQVSTGSKNEPAIRLYVKHGFRERERIKVDDRLEISCFEKG
ncbi:GNAT family N-acetyltransferase [Jeotgalibacillus sp. ET6]|uniref:GNAT family N-acetyltransferase n=1 Tax=Jeotgalibacillus sp. ET6 TaxID=3037260 RepID=UPI0024184424|nr:GNAT family N-acetyltransferase [Jeotgalibacillus sp. ET6]MDG5473527.1 GNAT family N-acetyltransferase [Jeotgalibacillus sp. ET6]